MAPRSSSERARGVDDGDARAGARGARCGARGARGYARVARRRRRARPRARARDGGLRGLRLVRLAVELDLEPDAETVRAASAAAGGLSACAGERVFVELCRVLNARRALAGLELMQRIGATAVVLPEVQALRGVE